MNLKFNTAGNLHKNIALPLDIFVQLFVYNETRKDIFKNASVYLKIFKSCGCRIVYIGGSFISLKNNPADIDICIDLTHVDIRLLRKKLPALFGPNSHNELGEIRKKFKCHLFTFDKDEKTMLEFLQSDRDNNRKGLVKISLDTE